MRALIIRRIITSIPLIVVVTGVTFVLESLVPGNTARAIVGASGSPAAYQRLRSQLGLNNPLWYQYWHYLDQLVHGSLGTSVFTGEPVSTLLNQRLAVTLSLVLLGTLFCAVVGVLLGVISAIRGGVVGRAVEVLSLVGLAGVAGVAKQTRDSMKDTLGREYIRTLRASGIGRRSIIWKHALRNGAIPVVTVLGLVFVSLLSATVFVEAVFVLPGLGSMAVTATSEHDIPVIEGIALYFTVLVVIVNLLLDVVYGLLNPKVRRA